ncbi:hypothetical protein ELQ92_00620 [Labedella populi]|uniref:Uncharacterized protein n=1 Tax=Labedella populi TaxID=2498850 RepID=A0A3S4AFW3_9MICO|nr:hypothetical protein [Labedella populi]RWZ67812.1 hypothetical protein ELQ92_00620 [Labedella populi]
MAAILVSSLVSGSSATSVSAEPLEEVAIENIADVVSDAAPDQAEPVQAAPVAESFVAEVGATEVTVPIDGDDGIEVLATIGGSELAATLSLPSGIEVDEGELASDGTIVFAEEGAAGQSDGGVAVQTLEDGATRIQTVIADVGSEHEFGYAVDGFRATIDAQGQAGFVSDGVDGAYVPVAPAWATDANGDPVDTHYEVRADQLFQVVVPGPDTVYPVVADPTWQWRSAAWGMTLNRKETASIKDYSVAAGMCGLFIKKKPIVACGIWASYLLTQAVTANKLKPKGCLHLVLAPLPGAIIHVKC